MANHDGKRALCVGINDYPGMDSDLNGCVNDANDWKNLLVDNGYSVQMLLDSAATRAAIIESLTQLLDGAGPGDSLMFTYSGHGSWLPDDDGDEADGRDEMLCPYDINEEQYLMDDDLAEIFGRKPEGVRLYFISDSCHSGSVARFAPPMAGASGHVRPRPRLLPPRTFVKDPRILEALDRRSVLGRGSKQKYPALLAAGCADFELSYDAEFNGRPNGAFTYAAINALAKSPGTPRDWMAEIQKRLPSAEYPQSPRLYGSRLSKNGPMF